MIKIISKTSHAPRIILALVIVLISSAALFCITTYVARAATNFNQEINYQGRLTTPGGVAVSNGSYNIRFKLYTVASGGSPIWSETDCYAATGSSTNCNGTGPDNRTVMSSGLFSILIGSTTPFTGVNFNQTLYLGVEIGGISSTSPTWDGEMTPRKLLGAVPAAMTAATLNGISDTQFFRNDIANSTSSASTFLNVTQSGSGAVANFIGASSVNVLTLLSNGNVGIGSSTPGSPLSVFTNSGASGATPVFTIASSTSGNTATTTLFTVLGNGNVGIGSSSPSNALTVSGNAYVSGNITASGTITDSSLTGTQCLREVAGVIQGTGSDCGGGSNYFTNSGATSTLTTGSNLIAATILATSSLTVNGTSTLAATLFASTTPGSIFFAGAGGLLSQNNADFFWDNNSLALDVGTSSANVTSNVNVGVLNVIATTTNTTNLGLFRANVNSFAQVAVVNANAGTTASADFIVGNNLNDKTSTSYYGDFGINSSANTDPSFTGLLANDTYLYGSDGGLDLGTATTSSASIIKFFTGGLLTANQRMTILANGNVGIGTASPSSQLEVAGNTALDGNLSVSTTTGTTTIAGNVQVNNGSLAYDAPSGITNIDSLQMGAMNFDNDAGAVSWVNLPVDASSSAGTVESYSANIDDNAALTIYSQSNGSGGVQDIGVGIGTTSPSNALEVVGNGYFSANLTSGGNIVGGNISGANITATGTLSVTGTTTLNTSLNGLLFSTNGLVSALATSTITNLSNLTTVGVLNAGSIASGFGSINIGADIFTGGGAILTYSTTTNATSSNLYVGDLTAATSTTFSSMTNGSVFFAGAGGLLSQDNGNLFYNTASTSLGIGTSSPLGELDIADQEALVSAGNIYGMRIEPNINGTLGTGKTQTAFYGSYNVPFINFGNATSTVVNLYNSYHGLSFNAGTVTNYYGDYIAAPAATGTITNTYALVTAPKSGNVGIGSTTPGSLLSVHVNSGSVATTPVFTIASSTAANIGTTTIFQVLGSGHTLIGGYSTTSTTVVLGVNGNVCNTTTCLTASSDARLKTNIQPIIDGLDIVDSLNPVYYNWNDTYMTDYAGQPDASSTETQIGFIAQEVSPILPEVVTVPDQNGYYGINYGKFAPVLAEAIKELDYKVDTLASSTALLEDASNTPAMSAPNSSAPVITLTTAGGDVSNLDDQVLALNNEMATLASTSVSSSDLASTTSFLLSNISASVTAEGSSTALALATSTSFIQTIASAVETSIQSAGTWIVNEVHGTLAIFDRVETKTVAVSDGIEMTDSATGSIYCVRITNGSWNKTDGQCPAGTDGPGNATTSSTTTTTDTNTTTTTSTTGTAISGSLDVTTTSLNNPVITMPVSSTDATASSGTTSVNVVPAITGTSSGSVSGIVSSPIAASSSGTSTTGTSTATSGSVTTITTTDAGTTTTTTSATATADPSPVQTPSVSAPVVSTPPAPPATPATATVSTASTPSTDTTTTAPATDDTSGSTGTGQ